MKNCFCALTVLLAVGGMISPAWTQVYYATVVGSVRDATGAALPNVEVFAMEAATGISTRTESDATGNYRFDALRPGTYHIRATVQGFKETTVSAVPLFVGKTTRIDLRMELGELSQSVSVAASGTLVQTETTERAGTLERREIEALPLSTRNIIELTTLVPGAAKAANYGESAPSVNGFLTYSNMYYVDGGGLTSLYMSKPVERLNVDSIEEFKVETSNFSADRGIKAGSTVTIATRHGTNEFHGTLFHFLRNDKLNARNFFAATRPVLRYNNFGGMLGGPIVRNKLFFQGSYEGYRERRASTFNITVPTAAEKQGIFTPGTGAKSAPIFNPFDFDTATNQRRPFPNNTIPRSLMNPISQKYLALYPDANREGGFPNFLRNAAGLTDLNNYAGRLDYNVSSKDLIFGRFSYQANPYYAPGAMPDAAQGRRGTLQEGGALVVAYNRVISARALNEFRFSMTRLRNVDNQERGGQNLAKEFGFTNADRIPAGITGCPTYSLSGVPTAAACGYPYISSYPQKNYFVSNDFSFGAGRHSFKTGIMMTRYELDTAFGLAGGSITTFNGRNTTQMGNLAGGQPFADFLLGTPRQVRVNEFPQISYSRKNLYQMYFMDDWKVSSRLTLNMGVRWDVNLPAYMANGRAAAYIDGLDKRTGQTVVFPANASEPLRKVLGGDDLGFPYRFSNNNWLTQPNWRNIGPRVGAAWRPFGGTKTVIRGGYGLYYDLNVLTIVDSQGYGRPFFGQFFPPARPTEFEPPPFVFGQIPTFTSKFQPGEQVNFGYSANPRMPDGKYHQWNLTFQRELQGGFLVELAYVGNYNTDTITWTAWNRTYPVGYTFRYDDGSTYTINQDTPLLQRQKYPSLAAGGGGSWQYARGKYHAAQFYVVKRMSHGFSFRSGYTLSRSRGIDQYQFQDEWNVGQSPDYRRANERPHIFFTTFVLELPGFKQRGAKGLVLGGWQLSGLVQMQSGPPLDIWAPSGAYPGVSYWFAKTVAGQNPSLPASERTLNRWFNTNAFAMPAANQFGDAFGSVRGIPQRQFDLAIVKYININERHHVQFRAEMFNFPNYVNFQLPGSPSVTTATFGKVTSAGAAREIQFGLKYQF